MESTVVKDIAGDPRTDRFVRNVANRLQNFICKIAEECDYYAVVSTHQMPHSPKILVVEVTLPQVNSLEKFQIFFWKIFGDIKFITIKKLVHIKFRNYQP